MRQYAPFPNGSTSTSGVAVSRGEVSLLLQRIAASDPLLAVHGRIVGRYAAMTAIELGVPKSTVDSLRLAGELHDVGKLDVPRHILHKPGPLDEREWALIRTHTEIGADLIRNAGLDQIADWVLAHHERPDGTGYPHGLTGAEIPIEAAILSVADAFHAMTSYRPHRNAMDTAGAHAELGRCSGSQFDPVDIDVFVTLVEKGLVETARL